MSGVVEQDDREKLRYEIRVLTSRRFGIRSSVIVLQLSPPEVIKSDRHCTSSGMMIQNMFLDSKSFADEFMSISWTCSYVMQEANQILLSAATYGHHLHP